ncbi:MAG: translocation/assembly module TamB domain-containing protein [Gammaproteobacteria bacterium]|nr:translocation/assembly module TamB domain-containing protein [Gammaproteobacteria bacterium]MDE2070276.1 translocation/assembly module TamB domain-containing protein [Gammaproteobacteria bacterium]
MIKRIVAGAIAALTLLIAGTMLFALHSETVLRWSVAQVLARYSGQLSVGTVQGSLSGPITLGDVQVHAPSFDAKIRSLTMDWRITALLARRVNITRLDLNTVQVTLKSGSGATHFSLVRPQPPHLPVAISVQQLRFRDLQIGAPGLTQPLNVNEAQLAIRLDNHAWAVSGLRASGAQLQVTGHADWQFQSGEHINGQLQWQLHLPQWPAFAGQASLAGDARFLRLSGSLTAPFPLQVAAQVHALFTAPSWDGTLEFSDLDPQRLRSDWPQLAARGNLRLQGDPQATVLTGDIDAREPVYGLWQSHVDLKWADRVLDIRSLDLARAQTLTRFALAGRVRYAQGKWQPALHGEWRALPLPLTGKPWFTSPRGQLVLATRTHQVLLTLDGALNNGGQFKAEGSVHLAAPHAWQLTASTRKLQLALTHFNQGQSLPPMDLQFRGHGDAALTVVDRFNAAWLGGRVQAQGRVPHVSGQNWQFTVAAQQLNPAALYPDFPGALNFNARLSGRFAPRASWTVQVTRLDGELRHVPVLASGSMSHRAGQWQFQRLQVQSGKNRLQLDGEYGRRAQLAWTLDAPDLASLWPGIHGDLHSSGQADFSGAVPQLSFKLQGQNLQYADNSVQTLDVQANLAGVAPASSASVHVAGAQLGMLRIDSADGEATGSPGSHKLKLTVTSPIGNIQIAGAGAYAQHVWQGDLTEVTLSPRGAGVWKNAKPWQPRIAAAHFSLPQACVTQAFARTCLQAEWQPGHWQTDALITAVPLADLQALLPQGLAYQGSFGGHLHVEEIAGERTLALDASLSPGAIRNVINRREVTLLAFTSGNVKLQSNNELTTGELNWSLADGGYLNMQSRIAHAPSYALSGNIRGELRDFQLIPALVPAVGAVDGKLDINLALSGTPSAPLFDGSAVLTGGELSVPRYGLHITDILLKLQGDGSHLTLDGSARSDNGNLAWTSSATRSANHWQAQGKLTGKDFRAVNTPEAQVAVSPALDLKLDNYDVWLDGDVTLPSATIQPRDLSQTASVSPDQVIVGAKSPPPGKWRVRAKVRAIMGPDVRFEGFGLSGRIAGSVQAVDEPGHPTTGNGTLEILGGKFTAYGQKLNIERGRLLFSGGPIGNPALDIRAIRPPAHPVTVAPGASEQKVGVIVRGSLQHPKVSLFAQPPLPQSQMLAYLITGQTGVNQNLSPLVGAPPTTASDITQIAGGQLLASELGQQIGVQDVSVQNVTLANGTSAPAMFLGKYLSPRLYVSYGTVFGQPFNTLRLQYTLSARWMLEAETGFASGADLIYSIER